MTLLADRPPTPAPPRDWWEWHEFTGGDGWAHLYRRSEMRNERLVLVRPWCLLGRPFPLDHDRPSITRHKVIPVPSRICPACAAQHRAQQIQVPRARGQVRHP